MYLAVDQNGQFSSKTVFGLRKHFLGCLRKEEVSPTRNVGAKALQIRVLTHITDPVDQIRPYSCTTF
jgi:hypothetical protein